jgi:hypothetical protein
LAVENLAAWAFMKMLQGFPGFHSLAGDRLPASHIAYPRYRYNPKDDPANRRLSLEQARERWQPSIRIASAMRGPGGDRLSH